jgi:hypothetical protein
VLVPVEEAIHQQAGMLLQIERVDWTDAIFVPIRQVCYKQSSRDSNFEEWSIDIHLAELSQCLCKCTGRSTGGSDIVFDLAVRVKENRIRRVECCNGLSDAMPNIGSQRCLVK